MAKLRKNADGLEYGGTAHKYYWTELNPNANVDNCLANCTTFVYGCVLEAGFKPVVSRIVNAGNWHTCLINGWRAYKYEPSNVMSGDIIEWSRKNHVAIVTDMEDGIKISGSYYTGEHGKSVYGGTFDSRDSFSTMQQVSEFMIRNYPYRFFHFVPLADEIRSCGGEPDYILKRCPVYPVKRNWAVDQIEVLTDQQNVRNSANEILGTAPSGYYNVISTISKNGYLWHEVEQGKYIAQVSGRVIFLEHNDIEALVRENEELKRRLEEISKLCSL